MIALDPTDTRHVMLDGVTYTVVEDLSSERVSFMTANAVAVGFAQPCIMSDEIDVFSTDEFGHVLSSDAVELPNDDESREAADSRLLMRILALQTTPATL